MDAHSLELLYRGSLNQARFSSGALVKAYTLLPSLEEVLETPSSRRVLLLIVFAALLSLLAGGHQVLSKHPASRSPLAAGDSGVYKQPQLAPRALPIFGHAISFAHNGMEFVKSSAWRLGQQNPFHMKVLGRSIYIIAGKETIRSFWPKSSSLIMPIQQIWALQYLFDMGEGGIEIYKQDNSGTALRPKSGSAVAPHNRINYLTLTSLVKNLIGPPSKTIHARWDARFQETLESAKIGGEWKAFPDFVQFWEDTYGLALLEAICGPILRAVNPDIIADIHTYDEYAPAFAHSHPKWLSRKAYAIRDKLLGNIMQWHAIARTMTREGEANADGSDPWWGSAAMREREEIFQKMDGIDHKSHAAADLGFIWAALANVVPTGMWQTFEVFKDEQLLSRVRSQLGPSPGSNTEELNKNALLNSVYSETLRLHVTAFCSRYTGETDFRINQWNFPKQSTLLVPMHPAHTDETVWNTRNGEHPVNDFWADRFLIQAGDRLSGPVQQQSGTAPGGENGAAGDEPAFTTEGTVGSYFPYGGGSRICPGRFLAKSTMLASLAMMVDRYEMDFEAKDSQALKMDPHYYGLGAAFPVQKMPFRIRRRDVSAMS